MQPPTASGHRERRRVQPSTRVQGVHAHAEPPGWETGDFPPGLPWPYRTEPAASRMGNCEHERER